MKKLKWAEKISAFSTLIIAIFAGLTVLTAVRSCSIEERISEIRGYEFIARFGEGFDFEPTSVDLSTPEEGRGFLKAIVKIHNKTPLDAKDFIFDSKVHDSFNWLDSILQWREKEGLPPPVKHVIRANESRLLIITSDITPNYKQSLCKQSKSVTILLDLSWKMIDIPRKSGEIFAVTCPKRKLPYEFKHIERLEDLPILTHK